MTAMARMKLLLLLATMPDEAFVYVINAMTIMGPIWPSEGGFAADSKVAIEETRKEAARLLHEIGQ